MIIAFSILHRLRKAFLVLYVLLWIAAFILTHVPGGDLPDFRTSDSVLHTVGFTGLTCVLVVTVAAFGVRRLGRVPFVLAVMMIYGAMDEYTQQFVGRSTDLRDWYCDAAGTVAGMIICELLLLLLVKPRRVPQDK
jgi:VanZ family protein